MGVEKQGSKGGTGGFLQLFDWNKKSRKKLFSNNSDFPDGSKQGKRSSSSLLVPRTHLIEEDDNGRSSIKGSSDYSCSSSVTDDEGNGIKAPGVVARLMGLDSLPTTSVVEPFSTPFFDCRSLRDGQYRRTPDFLYERQYMYSGKQPTKMDCFAHNPLEVRPQKSLNRPIERFQTEMLPPKSAKSISITHHKLFSPIKSPGYIPTKNAAQIMEEAARMIDPGPHTTIKGKLPLVGSSVPLKFRDLTEKMEAVPRPYRLPEASQRPADSRLPEPSQRPVDSRAVKHLKGQSLSKSWNGVEEAPQFRSYPSEESNATGLKNKGKSISLAVQAKVNVQKRGGLNSSSTSSLHGKRELREPKLNQTSKSQLNSQKNTQKKPSTPSVSGVLRQNNQKQNSSTNRDKLASKSVGSNQQGRKALPVEASFAQNKPLSKVAGNSKAAQRKSVLDTNDSEKVAPLLKTKNIPRKKRAIDGDSYLERSGFAETGLVSNDKKLVESNVAIEGHSKWMDDNRRKGMDVVSFTFTSPMKKPLPGQQASGLVVEKNTNFGVGCSYEQNPADKNTAKILSLGLNVIGGDALNLLLEQKLRELTNGIESSSSNSVTPGNVATSASIQSDLVSDLNLLSATRMECGNRSDFGLRRESIYDSNCFSTEAHMLQGIEEIDENSVDSIKARKEFNCRHPSPVSVLEPCFSNESCNSSDSADSGSINDTMQCSSAQSEQVVDTSCSKRLQSMGADTDLSESPSSICSGNFSRKRGKRFSLVYSRRTDKMELEYVREVISNADFMLKDLTLGQAHEMVNPHLFDLLENKKPWLRSNSEENIDSRISRRVLFDCVGECLDLRCRPYVNASCKKWAKGVAMVRRKGWLAEDIYKEIVGLRNMGNWMLDDLVDKDMSTGHGKWLDFETEEFELGEEIGRKILSSLVDEVVGDILLV